MLLCHTVRCITEQQPEMAMRCMLRIITCRMAVPHPISDMQGVRDCIGMKSKGIAPAYQYTTSCCWHQQQRRCCADLLDVAELAMGTSKQGIEKVEEVCSCTAFCKGMIRAAHVVCLPIIVHCIEGAALEACSVPTV